ncbi:hypothetical protein BU14_0099s0026 [Porphyra umbilicalis]|uniref:Uncharacterized protein n=1 Tax=Porphyra umbilicalis TaxID=2786 RepID=A0A1X6PD10_PORUM|nr:hypothetical protein BU14_0099s0026 [Porphyra umbilicalis]|eukprot:OSX78761.1 hypothetical protein BU14_0099s0026 [Porphyra umbilicalis]
MWPLRARRGWPSATCGRSGGGFLGMRPPPRRRGAFGRWGSPGLAATSSSPTRCRRRRRSRPRPAGGGGGGGGVPAGGVGTAGGVDTSSYELLAYARDRFDASGLQARRALPSRPLRVDVRADGYVFVLCAGSLGIMFCVVETGAGLLGLEMHEVYELRLPSVVRRRPRAGAPPKGGGAASPVASPRLAASTTGFDVGDYGYHGDVDGDAEGGGAAAAAASSASLLEEEGDDEAEAAYLVLPSGASALAPASEEVAEVRLFPPTDRVGVGDAAAAAVAARGLPSAEGAPTRMLILTAAGDLLLLDAEVGMYASLLADVEQLWFTPADCPPLDGVSDGLRPLWWAYGADGLQVCFPDGMGRVLAALDASAGGRGRPRSGRPPPRRRPWRCRRSGPTGGTAG